MSLVDPNLKDSTLQSWVAMSTRWYPIYQKGNPQLRVFLPNFWMKMVKPNFNQYKASTPANKVLKMFYLENCHF